MIEMNKNGNKTWKKGMTKPVSQGIFSSSVVARPHYTVVVISISNISYHKERRTS